jgi:hypothetical protein
VPRGVAPRALLGVLALIIAITLAAVPLVDARPKDRQNGKRGEVAEESVAPDQSGQAEAPSAEAAPPVEQPLTANTGGNDERTLISSDADGDYIPDALDNCPGVQNPDQADADGDGHGDVCAVYQDSDGDTVPDKSDNCPNIATSDFSDNDGDGVGNPCDKSPDGIEPTPEPVPELNGRGGEGGNEPPAPENGENQDGQSIERDGRSRSRERERTDVEKATITTGADDAAAAAEPPPVEEQYEEPVRDNPRRNEELIAEAAASGELYAPPEPPPAPQRAWDEPEESEIEWEAVIRIDAGAIDGAETASAADAEPNDSRPRDGNRRDAQQEERNARDGDVDDSEFARGWVRAKLILQEEATSDPGDGEIVPNEQGEAAAAPVPVESGLVITGVEEETPLRVIEEPGDEPAPDEPLDAGRTTRDDRGDNDRDRNRNQRSSGQDGSRRDGSSRGRAAPDRSRDARNNDGGDRETGDGGRGRKQNGDRGRPAGWDEDRYFDGGSALNWSADFDVAGTDDDALYLTQRSGSGTGKKRGFGYALPVDGDGTYLVRLYFAEPYWGAPGGPDAEEGKRVFSVSAEGETIVRDLDVYAEVGSMTALVKQVEVVVEDGELNLRFTADEGEPIVAAIEILQPAR